MVQTQFKIPKNIDVTKKLDIVSSIQRYKYNREGHKLRVDFLKYVKVLKGVLILILEVYYLFHLMLVLIC